MVIDRCDDCDSGSDDDDDNYDRADSEIIRSFEAERA